MKSLSDSLLRAAILKCQAEVEEAQSKIILYTTNPVGVGEHPDLVAEILSAAEAGASAKEKLEFLESVSPRVSFLKGTNDEC
tara:strand:- start:240 stop:485 length:246 start_codon:yes stop_codon:yes gene_type:complete